MAIEIYGRFRNRTTAPLMIPEDIAPDPGIIYMATDAAAPPIRGQLCGIDEDNRALQFSNAIADSFFPIGYVEARDDEKRIARVRVFGITTPDLSARLPADSPLYWDYTLGSERGSTFDVSARAFITHNRGRFTSQIGATIRIAGADGRNVPSFIDFRRQDLRGANLPR